MGVLLTNVKWKSALAYLEDLLIFLRTPDEQMKHAGQVLTLLNDVGVMSNLKKHEFLAIYLD